MTRKYSIYDSRVVNYDRKMFIRLAAGVEAMKSAFGVVASTLLFNHLRKICSF